MSETTKEKKSRAKSKATPAPEANTGAIQDIPHEVVPNESKPESLITGDEGAIKRELAKFNYTDAKIQELKDQFGPLTIAGADDKEGYQAVKKAWNLVRGVRTGFEKKGLELRNQFKKVLTAISGEEDRLITLVTPLEDELYKKWKAIDDEKDRLAKEKEEAEQRRLMARLEELVGMGMKLENGFYQLGETISMDAATLRALPDDQYEKLKQTVKGKADELAEKQRLAEEKAEEDRRALKKKEDDLKAEQEKLDKERAEMAKQRREIRVGKLEMLGMVLIHGPAEVMAYDHVRLYLAPLLDMDNGEFTSVVDQTAIKIKEIKDEAAKKAQLVEATRVRTLAMEILDFDLVGKSFVYDDDYHEPWRLDSQEIFTMDDGNWSDFLKQTGEKVMEYKNAKIKHDQTVAEEARQKEIKEKRIAELMQEAGIGYNYSLKRFQFANPQGHVIATWEDLMPLDDPDLEGKINEFGTKVLELKAQEIKAQEILEADKRKQEKLALSDKDRFEGHLTAISVELTTMVPGEFKTAKYKQRAQSFAERLSNLLTEFKS